MTVVRSLHGSSRAGSRRERQRLETRNRIFDAALEEFRAVGFGGAQIERIVEKAGVARGTFYFHFPTKEHVLLELQRRLEQRIVERLETLPPPEGALGAQLLHVVEAMAQIGEEFGYTLGSELIAMYVREHRVVDLSADPLVVAIVDLFHDAAERGELRDDISPEEAAGIFLTALFGFVAGSVDKLRDERDRLEQMIDVFTRGIAT